jgi:hypothetical protein
MRSLATFVPVIVLTLLISLLNVAAIYRGSMPSESTVANASLSWFLLLWAILDARKRGRVPCHEFGFLMMMYMPASLVWYLFWSRGWKGILPLAFIWALLVMPWLAWVVAYVLVYGVPPFLISVAG